MVVCKFFQQGHCRYGQSCRFEHIYGSKYSYRASQTAQSHVRSEHDVFKSNQSNDQGFGSSNSASSLFRSAVQNSSTFSNAPNQFNPQNQTRTSIFDRLGPQTNTFTNQNNQAKSIFAQANQNVFAQTQKQPATNVFQNQNTAKSLFSQAINDLSKQGRQGQPQAKFGEQNRFPVASNTGSVFQISQGPTTNVFGVSNTFSGSTNVFEQYVNNENGIYSKMEDLSQTDIEAFESADFKLGFIPELAPPQILCI